MNLKISLHRYFCKSSLILIFPIILLWSVSFGNFLFENEAGSDKVENTNTYWIYVGAESADLIHRIKFNPELGATVEQTTAVGEIYNKTEGPHGLAIDPGGEYLYMTTGHGNPDGKFWKYKLGSMELVIEPISLGKFPATLDVTPDGEYAFIVNFNLHGDMVPSSVSVVFLPDFVEVAQTDVGVMPHGSRISPDGRFQYTGLMMDDQLVEINTRNFHISRRFNVKVESEEPLPVDYQASISRSHSVIEDHDENKCSPTWSQPSEDGKNIYVACNQNDEILEISKVDWELSRKFKTGRGPYNLDISSDNQILAVTLKQGDGIEFIDIESGQTVARRSSSTTITHGVVISPDDRYAFVSVEGVGAEPGKVDIYELEGFERVASVETGQQASGIAFWKVE